MTIVNNGVYPTPHYWQADRLDVISLMRSICIFLSILANVRIYAIIFEGETILNLH